ncbi:MAG: OmpW family protein [Alphaproteobacteria bacterium]|jgi:outer membrane protein|nr:OmpW family protein [Alphaproteobacteria bacterium]
MGIFGKAAMAAGMLAAGLIAGQAQAQDAPRGKRAGDFMIGLGAVGVLPTNGGTLNRGLPLGGSIGASNSASPLLDFTYFFTPNISANLIAATTQHTARVRGTALGDVNAGSLWALPPTLTLQYHPFPNARLSPYVGVGLNVTMFYGFGGAMTPPVNRVRAGTTVGVAANIGVDYEITPNWLANLDVKWIQMEPTISVNRGLSGGVARLNPFVVSAAARYRF